MEVNHPRPAFGHVLKVQPPIVAAVFALFKFAFVGVPLVRVAPGRDKIAARHSPACVKHLPLQLTPARIHPEHGDKLAARIVDIAARVEVLH